MNWITHLYKKWFKKPLPTAVESEEEPFLVKPISVSYLLDKIEERIDSDSLGLIVVSTANHFEVFRDGWGNVRTDLNYYGGNNTCLSIHMPNSVVRFSFHAEGVMVSGCMNSYYDNSNDDVKYGTYYETYMSPEHITRFKEVLYKMEEYLEGNVTVAMWDAVEEFEQLCIRKSTEW